MLQDSAKYRFQRVPGLVFGDGTLNRLKRFGQTAGHGVFVVHLSKCSVTKLIDALSRSDNHHRDVLKPWLERSDALAYAREKAIRHIHEAVEELPAVPKTEAGDILRRLAGFVVARRK